MFADESYGDVALGVESAWPAILAMPLVAVVPLLQADFTPQLHAASTAVKIGRSCVFSEDDGVDYCG